MKNEQTLTEVSTEDEKYVDMSDEEFEKVYASGDTSPEVDNNISENSEETEEEEEDSDTDTSNEEVNTSDEETDNEETDDSNSTSQEENTEDSENNDSNEKTKESNNSINYEDVVKEIMKPFKANGKEVTLDSPEDVRSLMQMGANYVKKMETIKPSLKLIKSLEKAGIDENKLNLLIDIGKGDKQAIAKFMKENSIDPLDVDTYTDNEYVPNNNISSDDDVEFDETLSDIRSSEHYKTTHSIVTKVWDSKSREKILSNPKILKDLHYEVESGRYDKVQPIIDRERMFGRLEGVSDLDAYITIVSKMVNTEQPKTDTVNTKAVTKPVVNAGNKQSAKPTAKKQEKTTRTKLSDEEILSMSDEDFEKYSKMYEKIK